MICYNHPDQQACGTCKNCSKGICKNCTTDLGDGIACTASCVEDVRKLNSLIYRNLKVSDTTSKRVFIMPIFYMFIGSLLLGINLYLKKVDTFVVIFGVILILFGAYSLYTAVQLNKDDRI
ncbi:MAG: hypothetical protein COA38_01060 [Fluviicola sp.]|nr:MAG: hypothetical protein COA38_01060 [Fluviicola sp.]